MNSESNTPFGAFLISGSVTYASNKGEQSDRAVRRNDETELMQSAKAVRFSRLQAMPRLVRPSLVRPSLIWPSLIRPAAASTPDRPEAHKSVPGAIVYTSVHRRSQQTSGFKPGRTRYP